MTPIYIWLFDFAVEDAIPLSKMTIFMGAIVNYLILKNVRLDDDPNSPLINYSLAGVIVPMLLAGTSIGVFGAKLFPPILILTFLSGFLILSTFKMTQKAIKLWKKETEENNKQFLDHSYSQTKFSVFDKNKNVYSVTSVNQNKQLKNGFGYINRSANFQSMSVCTNKKQNDKDEKEPFLNNPKFATPNINNINLEKSQKNIDSENSEYPNSKSVMTNPFWNKTESVKNNISIGVNSSEKANKENFVSKFKFNPGKIFHNNNHKME